MPMFSGKSDLNNVYEKNKYDYYGQTEYNIPALEPMPELIKNIHSTLISNYESQHKFNFDSFLGLLGEKLKLLDIDINHDFLEHCILHASNLLPIMQDHYKDVMRVMFSPNQHGVQFEFPLMSFYIGIDIHKTFGFGNQWPLFHDTIVPGIYKNLNIINTRFAHARIPLNDLSEDQKRTFKNIQYCFLLDVESVIKTVLTNPIFTAQYLIEKENDIADKPQLLSACERLLKEMKSFKNLKNGIPDTIINTLEGNLNGFVIKYDALKDCPKETRQQLKLSTSQHSFIASVGGNPSVLPKDQELHPVSSEQSKVSGSIGQKFS